MHEYSPRRRTAVIFSGIGMTGAYHAGVLKALDESGVKVDLVVGSGIGAVTAAFAAVSAGEKLYGPNGFWNDVRASSFYRLRFGARLLLFLLAVGFAAFILPVVLALIAGVLAVPALLIDFINPGWVDRVIGGLGLTPQVLRSGYSVVLAVPAFALFLTIGLGLTYALLDRRRFQESLETLFDIDPAKRRLLGHLWEAIRGPSLSAPPPATKLGERYLDYVAENEGQPRFRRLILRTTDLDTGRALCFALLDEESLTLLSENRRVRHGGSPREPGVVDLNSAGAGRLVVDALLAGLLPPLLTPLQRMTFPKGGMHSGEAHRLVDGTLSLGSGLADALAAGIEQVVLVSGVSATPMIPPRKRGPFAAIDSLLSLFERQALERDIRETERINLMIDFIDASGKNCEPGWRDPATDRLYHSVNLYVIRPRRRSLGPLEFDGRRDPVSESLEDADDLMEQGYHDAYYQFVEPVVGAPAAPLDPVAPLPSGGRAMQL